MEGFEAYVVWILSIHVIDILVKLGVIIFKVDINLQQKIKGKRVSIHSCPETTIKQSLKSSQILRKEQTRDTQYKHFEQDEKR